jgi:hypothetical protein
MQVPCVQVFAVELRGPVALCKPADHYKDYSARDSILDKNV